MSSKPIRVIFFGDSICVGQGVSIYQGWVPRIAQDMEALSQEVGREILVTNASVNGRTTRQALEDMPYQVQSQGVDIVIIQFGLNDCNHWVTDKGLPRVSCPAFIANVAEIIARAKRFGAFRTLLNSNHPTTRSRALMQGCDISYEQSNRSYNQALREFAQAQGGAIQFQDMEQHFNGLAAAGESIQRYLLEDELHLSRDGHTEYHKVMGPAVTAAVRDFAAQAPA
jgi:acyl-CoA thioesterase-1